MGIARSTTASQVRLAGPQVHARSQTMALRSKKRQRVAEIEERQSVLEGSMNIREGDSATGCVSMAS